MDNVISYLQGTIAGVESEVITINQQLEKGDYTLSKKEVELELEDQRDFLRQLRKAIKKLGE